MIGSKMLRVMFLFCVVSMLPGLVMSGSFRFAVIGDRTGDAQDGVYEGILDEVERLRPDFAITVGDAIEGYTDDTTTMNSEWHEYLSMVERLSMPLYFTPGNHDITTEAMRSTYERYIGAAYYSFDYGDCHFVVLDNAAGGGGPAGPLGEEQWSWLVNDLKEHEGAAHTFLFCHKPFWYENRFEIKPDSLHDLAVQFGVDAVFTGHYHRYFSAELDGVKYTGVGSSGGGSRTPFEYLRYHHVWVTVDSDGIHIAPIDQNSVHPWDYNTADDLRLATKVERLTLKMTACARESELRSPDSCLFPVLVSNHSATDTLNDTLRWDIPEGWSIQPESAPLQVDPGGQTSVAFRAFCEGELFPRPTVSLECPIGPETSVKVEAGLWVARELTCFYAESAPIIDGSISESVWKNPITILHSPDGGPTTIDSTWFYFAYDSSNLYLGAVCREPMMDSLRANVTERDGSVYGEDCVGYFLDPGPIWGEEIGDIIHQVYVNPLGTVFDQRIVWDSTGWYESDLKWDGEYEVATFRGDDFWSVELRVPFAQFGAGYESGSPWYLNFRRKQKRLKTSGDWQIPIDYTERTYGRLTFEK